MPDQYEAHEVVLNTTSSEKGTDELQPNERPLQNDTQFEKSRPVADGHNQHYSLVGVKMCCCKQVGEQGS